jgi:hypothetical protein
MFEGKTLYKYRSYSAQSLSILINRELYFASPQQLNDPFDCQLSIPEALAAAVTKTDSMPTKFQVPLRKKLRQFGELAHIYEKMAADWEKLGVLSLSEVSDNSLMWTHYSDNHRGFCLGFELEEPFTSYNEEHLIIGCTRVDYLEDNPFVKYFWETCMHGKLPIWDEFWKELLSIGMAVKSQPWSHEREVRVLRMNPGVVQFNPHMLSEVVFGSRMPEQSRITVRRLLSSEEWQHVKYFEIHKSESDLSFNLVDA